MSANSLREVANWLKVRLAEPSTYAGLALLSGSLGFQLDPGLLKQLATVGMGASGIIAMVLPEGKSNGPTKRSKPRKSGG